MTKQRSQQPLVSVVLCTYNRARLIRRAVNSVICQRYQNWQLIIVDDGSTDRTPEVLSRLAAADPRIVVVRQRNRGLARARNAGLRKAKGEFITFLDSDDEYRPSHLASRVATLRRMQKTDMLYGGLRVTGPIRKRYVVDLDDPAQTIHVRHCYVGGTFFMRRRIIGRGYRFRNMPFGEDLDLIRRVQRRFRVRKVEGMRTYVYHCETSGRLCDTFTRKRPQT